jgi:hypothetical protein
VHDALLAVANRREEGVALAVLLDDGVLMRGQQYVITLGESPDLTFFEPQMRRYDVDVHRVSGLAAIAGDGTVTRYGQYPTPLRISRY